MFINPDRLSLILGISHLAFNPVVFPKVGIDKAYIAVLFE